MNNDSNNKHPITGRVKKKEIRNLIYWLEANRALRTVCPRILSRNSRCGGTFKNNLEYPSMPFLLLLTVKTDPLA